MLNCLSGHTFSAPWSHLFHSLSPTAAPWCQGQCTACRVKDRRLVVAVEPGCWPQTAELELECLRPIGHQARIASVPLAVELTQCPSALRIEWTVAWPLVPTQLLSLGRTLFLLASGRRFSTAAALA